MSLIAPQNLLFAQAIGDTADTRLAVGTHLRVMPSTELGLPLGPLQVLRAQLALTRMRELARSDLYWVDADGAELRLPFEVTPDRPVIGYFPQRALGACCWLECELTAAAAQPDEVTRARSRQRLDHPVEPELVQECGEQHAAAYVAGRSSVRVDLLTTTQRTSRMPARMSSMASRSAAPYMLAGSSVSAVMLTGSARVSSVRWLDTSALLNRQFAQLPTLALPRPAGVFYRHNLNAEQARAAAYARVEAGAPRRRGAHEDAGPSTPADARSHVEEHAAQLDMWLARLLDEEPLNAEHEPIAQEYPLEDRAGDMHMRVDENARSFHLPLLASVLACAQEPNVARYLGFATVDTFVPPEGQLSIYVVRGVFRRPASWSVWDERDAVRFRHLPAPPSASSAVAATLDLCAIAVACLAHPPDPPPPPRVALLRNGPWLPRLPPPHAEREVVLKLARLRPGAGLAFSRRVGAAPTYTRLQPRGPSGRPQLLGVALSKDAPRHGSGEISDRSAPEAKLTYAVAQSDLFGRWSPPAMRVVPALEPPRLSPPTVTLRAAYDSHRVELRASVIRLGALPPGSILPGVFHASFEVGVPDSSPSEVLSARVELALEDRADHPWRALEALIAVADPPPRPLPPRTSGQVVSRIPLQIVLMRSAGDTTQTLPDAEAALELACERETDGAVSVVRAELVLRLPAPSLPPAAARTIRLVEARWVDLRARASESAPAAELAWRDRTAPPEISDLPRGLMYTPRPDATGKANIELRWSAAQEHTMYRLFVSDELRLRENLPDSSAPDLNSPDPARRAAVFLSAPSASFKRNRFERLCDVPATTPQLRYPISGSLTNICFVRIVPISAAGIEAPFEACPLLAFAVPNASAPPRPSLTLLTPAAASGMTSARLRYDAEPLEPTAPISAVLELHVPPGLSVPRRFRLRRSVFPGTDAARMPVVFESAWPAAASHPDGRGHKVLVELSERMLRRWNRYYWVAEVCGLPASIEAADAVPLSAWSDASLPCTHANVPAHGPSDVSDVHVTRHDDGVLIEWRFAQPPARGNLGFDTVSLISRDPHGREQVVRTGPAQAFVHASAADGCDASTRIEALPEPLSYFVVVTDALRRASRPVGPRASGETHA